VTVTRFENRLPTGPGSRGGHWHEKNWRNEYQRIWRQTHPDYQERERLRLARRRGHLFPADAVTHGVLPPLTVTCVCDCGCLERVAVECGFCSVGIHRD
jgi:hypothetical protein